MLSVRRLGPALAVPLALGSHEVGVSPAERVEIAPDARVPHARIPRRATWTPAQNMTTGRWSHSATKLEDGRVLVAGGADSDAWRTAEIYDPASGTWTRTKQDMPHPHHHHVATRLCDGTVFVACGISDDSSTSHQSEIYDPRTDTWKNVKPSSLGHTYGTATLLDDCTVLVVGGYDARWQTEIYNPMTNTWTAVAKPLSQTRFYHTATKLPDGRVMVPGGGYDNFSIWYSLVNVDVFTPGSTPGTGTWSLLKSLAHPRRTHGTVLLPNGAVLVTGGSDGGVDDGTSATVELDTTEIYDPVKKTWSAGPTLKSKRTAHTATLLPNGAVLIAGGVDDTGSALSSTETYQNGTTTAGVPMARDRYTHTATLLDDGAVLIAGGLHQATAELYTLGTNGTACAGGGECVSGYCADGVCCDTACDDGCSSCASPGAKGTCGAICADDTHALTCGAASGTCPGGKSCGTVDCSPFLCTAAARGCSTTCTSSSDCAPGFACGVDHRCAVPPPLFDGDPGACRVGNAPGTSGAAGGAGAALAAALAWLRRRTQSRGPSLRRRAGRST